MLKPTADKDEKCKNC